MAIDPQKYSIYAQRSAEKEYVDWGKVARDVTTGITTIAAERQWKTLVKLPMLIIKLLVL